LRFLASPAVQAQIREGKGHQLHHRDLAGERDGGAVAAVRNAVVVFVVIDVVRRAVVVAVVPDRLAFGTGAEVVACPLWRE
jgi:hypothetical protein